MVSYAFFICWGPSAGEGYITISNIGLEKDWSGARVRVRVREEYF
jgi:hypothetical protein